MMPLNIPREKRFRIEYINIEAPEHTRNLVSTIPLLAKHRLCSIPLTTLTTNGGLISLSTGSGLMSDPMTISNMLGLLFGTIPILGSVTALNTFFISA